MTATRTEKVSMYLTPELAARLTRYAQENHWSASTAAAVLVERALPAEEGPGPVPADHRPT